MSDSFLSGYKKEWTSEKKEGKIVDTSSDPISKALVIFMMFQNYLGFRKQPLRGVFVSGFVASHGSHHMLCAVDFTEKKVKMYDSNKRNHEQDHTGKGGKILAFVEAKAKRDRIPFDVNEWTIEDKTNCPQQTNGHDCGVYVCTLAYFLSQGKRMDEIVETMDPIFIIHQRQRMLFSLLYPIMGISLPFVDFK